MLIKAREEGFREAMEIFGLTNSRGHTEGKPEKTHREKRRDIRRLIITELSFSGNSMTQHQLAKAINHIPEKTDIPLQLRQVHEMFWT